jgi:glycosyltransferase 2 family protein
VTAVDDETSAPPSARAVSARRRMATAAARLDAFKQRAPRLIAFLRVVYYPFALALVGWFAYQATRKIDLATLRWWPLAGSYAAALVWWSCLALAWSVLVSDGYQAAPFASWCRTQVARYLPGGFWAPLARATTVQGRMRDKVAAVSAENVTVLCVALGAGAVWASVHNPLWLPLAVVAMAPTLAGRWLERRTRVSRRAVIRASATYAVGYLAYGISGILAQVAVSGVRHPTYPLYVAGASCVAWAIGLVVVFAPGGVGVREVVYVWMLSGLYPQADLKGAAVASRLVTVFAELTVLLAVGFITRASRSRTGDQSEADHSRGSTSRS